MTYQQSNSEQINKDWKRFCDLLWCHDSLGFWLDISKMKINSDDIKKLENKFEVAFNSMKLLEGGSIANIDESRQVGHYWLRNPSISPDKFIKEHLISEQERIVQFANDILKGNISTNEDKIFTEVLWIGIGGSSLGPILLINSLKNFTKGLNFHFLDNVDPQGISDKLDIIGDKLKSTLIIVVSKSGGTIEPKICLEQVEHRFNNIGTAFNKHAVAITMKNSNLDLKAISDKWLNSFDLPDWVGGRTSITSAVGLLPLALINADTSGFLRGASEMDEATREPKILENPAALLAASWYISGNSCGKKDMVVLPYKDKLEVFSRYLQQLVMESLGKEKDREGNIVNQGIAVYGNKGSTDQHAYIQQLRDGIDNFFAIFIEIIKDTSTNINKINMNPNDYLSGFLQGTRSALTEANKENITISIEELNERTLGALIALFERAVGLYAELININAYDQPGVESGKIAAADIIQLQKSLILIFSDKRSRSISDIHNQLTSYKLESIFITLRSMCLNNKIMLLSGDWNKPESLLFKKVDRQIK